MSSIAAVLGFSWPYLRRYWGRVVASVIFGLLFALANASFVWAVKVITGRFSGDTPTAIVAAPASLKASVLPLPLRHGLEWVKEKGKRLDAAVDPWLPRSGHPMELHQVIGLLCFLPFLVGVRALSDYFNNYCMGWVAERTSASTS